MPLIVAGAAGRMGRALVNAIENTSELRLVAAIERPQSPFLGADAGTLAGLEANGITLTDNPRPFLDAAEGIVDFSTPASTLALAKLAAEAGVAHIVGTTGLTESDGLALAEAAHKIPLVRSGNMSLGVNLLAHVVRLVAKTLGPEFDIEILEMHHRMKVDAPSGTALMLGEAAAEGRGVDLSSHSVRGRDGITGARKQGDIGFATLRGGGIVGDHSVIFASEEERITLSHFAENRALFARGALKAALWTRGRPPGLYNMNDVLGL